MQPRFLGAPGCHKFNVSCPTWLLGWVDITIVYLKRQDGASQIPDEAGVHIVEMHLYKPQPSLVHHLCMSGYELMRFPVHVLVTWVAFLLHK